MIEDLDLKLKGELPVSREELLEIVSSWGRDEEFETTDDIFIDFFDAKECYPLSNLDVSQIKDLSDIFCYSLYNGDLSKWDVSNCSNMAYMFYGSKFNNDSLKDWNTSNLLNIDSIFKNSKFNGDISDWDVSNVINMNNTFAYSYFNGDISNWKVDNCLYMDAIFYYSNFNGNLSKWNLNQNVSCNHIFYSNEYFYNKYNNGNEIPVETKEFLEWFEKNRAKIANHYVSNEEKLEIDDYLSIFDLNKELSIKEE